MEITLAGPDQQITPRERSTIRFPYGDLEDAIAIAGTIHDNRGRSCALDELAADLGQSISGAFRTKVATAATFGVIETARREVTLTDLGVRIVDADEASAAKVDAFLAVPLFKAVYERFRGSRLPADQGLESELIKLGVSPKQADKARQALYRSAEQAGFLHSGRDRLVAPPATTLTPSRSVQPQSSDHIDMAPTNLAAAPTPTSGHPLLVGLWLELPDPKVAKLSRDKQEQWIQTATLVLSLLYGNGADSPSE